VILLSAAAISDYREVRWQSEVKIDQKGELKDIPVFFEVDFPRLPCFGIIISLIE
jgi:hypothetical protein